jgi:hypothetical protein
VSRATQGEIRGRVLAALGEWLEVVKFEPMRLGATPSSGLDMRTLLAVEVEHRAPHGSGNMAPPPAPARVACDRNAWASSAKCTHSAIAVN